MNWQELIRDKSNIVFVGESGCGKTELAVNCAIACLETAGEKRTFTDAADNNLPSVTLLDMDQTKAAFRSRDLERQLSEKGIPVLYGEQFMESPTLPPGTLRLIQSPDQIAVLDVGGNETGAITMGQFEEELKGEGTVIFFVISPYRLLSIDSSHVNDMILRIKDYGSIGEVRFLGNPNMGEYTDREIAEDGIRRLKEMGQELGITYAAFILPEWLEGEMPSDEALEEREPDEVQPAKETIAPAAGMQAPEKYIYIKRYLCYPGGGI